ncbi:hypothetical protein DPX16_0092 [Anabarilius grahami]|uniref:Ig-like domain-containing protein n=1 Tax=Anabarilius grahami TaxID=495550 RepID=A0A3N0YIR5_ANAGA|nr:hypothetical protein DPX16_0092 [Anabarilius grahami]
MGLTAVPLSLTRSCFSWCFILSPRQLLEREKGVRDLHSARSLTTRPLTFSPVAGSAKPRPPRHRSSKHQLLSDSSRGAGGKYTVSSATVNHTGVYVCRAEREETAYETTYSNTQLLWVTAEIVLSGVSPRVSLIISPSRTQHFRSDSLSLSCEDQSNSDGWTVRRYTDSWPWLEDCSSSYRGSRTGSTCTISSTRTWDTGVYWCQSESGEKYHPVNITVQQDTGNNFGLNQDFSSACRSDAPQPKGILQVSYI